ncbi:uncharacterized protein LOC106654750 [Trichogramma pretiosum]|uniref:uncharacterized protein LOC106654750 n=1 Tax=Trichogramma pretiosum TaxID=7493 RepID=UPI0006C99485|nr:uncharacterized protein LOC106654750 [Trichogramma pretiosum]
MENKDDTVRMKKDPSQILTIESDDHFFDSMNSCKAENFETSHLDKPSANYIDKNAALPERINKNLSIVFECGYVKSESKSLSTKVCKTEYRSCEPMVKIENENQPIDMNEKIFIDVEYKNVKLEPMSFSTNLCKFEHQNFLPIVKMENKNKTDDMNKNIFIDFESKGIKSEQKSLLTTISKTDDQSYAPIVKVENSIHTRYLEYKSLMILI